MVRSSAPQASSSGTQALTQRMERRAWSGDMQPVSSMMATTMAAPGRMSSTSSAYRMKAAAIEAMAMAVWR